MSTTCPNGHESEWADWCSVCGERLAAAATGAGTAGAGATAGSGAPPDGAARATSGADEHGAGTESGGSPGGGAVGASSGAAAPGSTSGPSCENCGVARREDDVFCESCGYDFASGSLPQAPDTDVAGSAGAHSASGGADSGIAPPMHARISVDADFFAASVGDVELTLPDPVPDMQIVPLTGIRILIGRTSNSRAIFPEIDVRALTQDPAVSSRHAMLERGADGSWTMTDLGSTNGTFLTASAEDPVAAGVALPVAAGSVLFLGAWTRIELAEST